MKYLFIDIRKSDEAYSKHFSQKVELGAGQPFYNIPMNMIRFNVKNITDHLDYFDAIYIVCNSTNRSNFIKNKYFSGEDRVRVSSALQFNNLHIGTNKIVLDDGADISVEVSGTGGFNLYSAMRILQLVLGVLILSIGGYTYVNIRDKKFNKVPLIILLIMGANALFNGLTSTCGLSYMLMDYLN